MKNIKQRKRNKGSLKKEENKLANGLPLANNVRYKSYIKESNKNEFDFYLKMSSKMGYHKNKLNIMSCISLTSIDIIFSVVIKLTYKIIILI